MPVRRWRIRTVAVGALLLLAAAACGDGGAERMATPTATDEASPARPAPTSPSAASPSAGGATPSPADADLGTVGLSLEEFGSGFEQPVAALPDRDAGLLVLELPGRLQLVRDGRVRTYLDITDRVTTGGERGLLGAAFPPHPGDDRILVHYSGVDGRTTLSRFATTADGADPASEEVLLTVEQPASNHNGGQILFGPDGYLYLGLGDGGAADDRFGNGQRPDTLLGTVLRLDVAGEEGYAIPPDNPFADGRDGAPEVWAYGLRNPYRLDFGAGRLFIADVGQNQIEEINAAPADAAGRNYGWPLLEGPVCFAEPDCDPSGTTLPVTSYRHEDTGGCAVIGGGVYGGEAIPGLLDWYVYSDLCTGFLRAVRVRPDGTAEEADLTDRTGEVARILGFGTDPAGELLLTLADGRLLRLVPA